jgi:hypothetical protein
MILEDQFFITLALEVQALINAKLMPETSSSHRSERGSIEARSASKWRLRAYHASFLEGFG